MYRLLCRHQISNSKYDAGRAIGVESRTGITGIQHLNRHSAESHPPTMLLTWPIWESSPKPCPAPVQLYDITEGPAHMSGSPHARKERSETQEAAISTRVLLSFLHLWLQQIPRFLPSQVATLAPSTWKSQTIVYDCIRRQGRDAKQYCWTYRTTTIARGGLSPLSLCTFSVPRLNIHSNEARQIWLVSSQLELSKFSISVSLCHHAAHRHCYPLGSHFWLCLCRWFQQRVSGVFRDRCDSLLFLCRWRLCR